MKTYSGRRLTEGCEVYVTEDGRSYPLALRLDIRNHSPTGFEWGFGGSGPAQLALAILADHVGPRPLPERCIFCETPLEAGACPGELSGRGCGWKPGADWLWDPIMGGLVHYQEFKRDVVAALDAQVWELTADQIGRWMESNLRGYPV